MRIGILTFHCAHNYGAMLQCYALQEYLKGRGDEVYVIDYRPDYLTYCKCQFHAGYSGTASGSYGNYRSQQLYGKRKVPYCKGSSAGETV